MEFPSVAVAWTTHGYAERRLICIVSSATIGRARAYGTGLTVVGDPESAGIGNWIVAVRARDTPTDPSVVVMMVPAVMPRVIPVGSTGRVLGS